MVGIYKITNCINKKSYIGQSKDIAQRINEHFYHRTALKASLIDKDILEFGINNFTFQILELCNSNELDLKEDFYIKLFKTNINGYNMVAGGQHNIGESNANVKITEQDVYNLRECYKMHMEPHEIFFKYFANRISISYFFNLWEGKSWKNIHMDVYTEENRLFYMTMQKHEKSYKFMDKEVIHFRQRFVNETASQIYMSLTFFVPYSAFRSMLNGSTYKHLPIYDKKNKIWYNN